MGKVLQLFPELVEDLGASFAGNSRNLCEFLVGDAKRVLVGFPDEVFQTVVTSPRTGDYAITGGGPDRRRNGREFVHSRPCLAFPRGTENPGAGRDVLAQLGRQLYKRRKDLAR